jgi:phosphomannomutase
VTIQFGTDGWRAVIGEGFTYANLERVTQAFADHLRTRHAPGPVVVGYDRRFMSEQFARRTAAVLAANGRHVLLFDRDTPTPLVSFELAHGRHAAGVVITASHNPAAFNGFKIKEQPGRSATPETVRSVEALLDASPVRHDPTARISVIEPPAAYGEAVAQLVDLDSIRRAGIRIVADPIHGAGGRAFERFAGGDATEVHTIRAERDTYFGGVNPEPIGPNLGALATAVRDCGALLGLATDGDADRLGVVDELGQYVTSQLVLAILLQHLAGNRDERGDVVRTVSQSRLIDRMAADYGLHVRETPIGFKHVADAILAGDVLIGGEESGGVGLRGFIPERDGVLAGLLLTEAVVAAGVTPSQLVESIQRRYGPFYYDRRDVHVRPEIGLPLVTRLAADPPERIGGHGVSHVTTLDGTKLHFDDESWLLFRQSGTEPALRIYAEATSERFRDVLLDEAVAVVARMAA